MGALGVIRFYFLKHGIKSWNMADHGNTILQHDIPWGWFGVGRTVLLRQKVFFSVGRPDGRRWVKEEGGSRSRTLQPVRGEGYEPASKMQSQCKDATKIPYQVIKGHVRCSTLYTVGADPDQESWYDEKIGVRGVGTSFYPTQDFWNGIRGIGTSFYPIQDFWNMATRGIGTSFYPIQDFGMATWGVGTSFYPTQGTTGIWQFGV